MPTDTIYGIVGSALNARAVRRIYRVRRRNARKPLIVLIGRTEDLDAFGVKLGPRERELLGHWWPGKVSVILPVRSNRFSYLHRGTRKLAFRLPRSVWLRNLLKKTGPLVAPSANPEGESPARTIGEAKRYFGERADFYQSAGRVLASLPSTLIEMRGASYVILRSGAGSIKGRAGEVCELKTSGKKRKAPAGKSIPGGRGARLQPS